MFKHLLVPLDGSRLAESALPPAAYLARVLGAQVTLLHLIERRAPHTVHGDHHLAEASEAEAYVADVARRAFDPGTTVTGHVHTVAIDSVAHGIAEHVAEFAADLVVLCTHGRSGPRSWLFGSIAQRVIGLADTPVLLVQPRERPLDAPFACRRLLVPLDGQPDHEQGVAVAAGLGQACEAAVHVVMVVPTRGTLDAERAMSARLMPGAAAALLDLEQEAAASYLAGLRVRLEPVGLTITAEVRRGDPAGTIAAAAERADADLIVLGTHGLSHQDAFWSGSVTPKIASRARVPLLLVPVVELKAAS
jgi:nucleotide-binding universal stress UspA family protein